MSAENTTTTAVSPEPPAFVLASAHVRHVERLSPTFARITFAGVGPMGVDGPIYDQRIKLVFPPEGGRPPSLPEGDDWYRAWLAVPESERGSMRTYSVRDLTHDGDETLLTVDFVLHLAPGFTGPASRWASTATPGDEVLVVGPRRGRPHGGGIEFAPGEATEILLVGDETAAPAIARILADVPATTTGAAFIEVPEDGDRLSLAAPTGVTVHWLPRGGAEVGARLTPAVLEHLAVTDAAAFAAPVREDAPEADLVWETPTYSALGEELADATPHAGRYFWIAGESGVVTALRRHLVKGLGVDRSQVAFMGYWRRGVAMRG